jgi:two-component system sensor histidine kinase ChiS
MAFVNDYLHVMEPPITQHNGFIDKYIGDAVMALFDHPEDAIRASIECLKALHTYNETRQDKGELPVKIGIGLHTGPLMMGTVGSEKRLSCTVLGDSVNLAARVESLTKLYGASLLITEQTLSQLDQPHTYHTQQVDRVAAKGKTEPVNIFEVWDGLSPTEQQQKETSSPAFQAGYDLFVQGQFDKALTHFSDNLTQYPDSTLDALYVKRCQELKEKQPEENWDGVVRLNQK